MNLPKGTTDKDAGIILTTGTLGFLVDTFLFPGGIPPGTTAALFASASLGIVKLLDSNKESKAKEIENIVLNNNIYELLEKCKGKNNEVFTLVSHKLFFYEVQKDMDTVSKNKFLSELLDAVRLLCQIEKIDEELLEFKDTKARDRKLLEYVEYYFDKIISGDDLIQKIKEIREQYQRVEKVL